LEKQDRLFDTEISLAGFRKTITDVPIDYAIKLKQIIETR